ncbi:MAG: RNA polymerase sigma factor [Terriglobia bacterium]
MPTLLLRAQQGEEAAFKALYEIYKARVYSACRAITQREEAAEKLTYHVFLTLFRNVQEFQEERQFVSRMDECTVRYSIAYLRNARGWAASCPQPGSC